MGSNPWGLKIKKYFFSMYSIYDNVVGNKFTKIRKLKNEDILLNLVNILSNIINKYYNMINVGNYFEILKKTFIIIM